MRGTAPIAKLQTNWIQTEGQLPFFSRHAPIEKLWTSFLRGDPRKITNRLDPNGFVTGRRTIKVTSRTDNYVFSVIVMPG